jgi:hypothetical protein
VSIDGNVAAAASFGVQSYVHFHAALCFLRTSCVGINVDASQDTSVGADVFLGTHTPDSEDIEPLLTNYMAYPQPSLLNSKHASVIGWGGLWVYATYPHVVVTAYANALGCSPSLVLYEYQPSPGSSNGVSDFAHPLGSMMYSNSIVPFTQKFYQFPGETTTIPLPIPVFSVGPGTGRRMLSSEEKTASGPVNPVGTTAVDEPGAVDCGRNGSRNKGPVPALRVKCPLNTVHADTPVGTECRSIDCCSGVAIKTLWNSFACQPKTN